MKVNKIYLKIKCSCQTNKNPKTNMMQGYHNCKKCDGIGYEIINIAKRKLKAMPEPLF